jgi:hypothetical protein
MFLDHCLGERFVRDVRAVLGRDHHGVDVVRLAIDVAHADLRLRVGPQPRQAAVLSQFAVALHQPVRVEDRHRHELRRFIAGIAVHQSLVARALFEVESFALIHALGDVRGLFVESGQHGAGAVVEAHLRAVVADAFHHRTGEFAVLHHGAGSDLPGHDNETGCDQSFGGNAAMPVLGKNCIQHGVGNLIRHFVGMTFGDRFGGKQEIAHYLDFVN